MGIAMKHVVCAVAAGAILLATVAACSSSSPQGSPLPTIQPASTTAVDPALPIVPDTTTTVPVPVQPTTTPPLYPTGYPKVVAVASLPFQVKNWYRMESATQAVAIAPGVWAPLSPGATVEDASTAGVLDGFCGSVKAYERQYLGGQEQGGTCW
jgi:hypothetical protein